MEILSSLDELKRISSTLGNPALQTTVAHLETQLLAVLKEKQDAAERCQQMESDFAAKFIKVRHDAAQPLTTVQFFLDLLPTVLQQEQLVPEKYVNRNFWTHTYGRAQEAVKSIPKILQRP